MTILLPDRATARRTRIRIDRAPHRARLRTETVGDPARPALRAMSLAADECGARLCLVPDGALLLAGDAVVVEVEVGRGARLDLVEPGGTVAYDMRGGSAIWDVRIRLEQDATLVWAGEPFVVSAGARVTRATDVHLEPGAALAVRETLVLGRHRERHGSLVQRWRATGPDGGALLVEDLRLGGTAHRPGLLGGNKVLGSVTVLGVDVPADDAEPDPARLDLEGGGTQWRRLGVHAHEAVPEDAWRDAWKAVVSACARSGPER